LGLNKDEVIFIDNKQSSVDGAKEVGIHALLYTTTDKLKQDLAKNGVHVSYFVPLAQRLTCLVYIALPQYI